MAIFNSFHHPDAHIFLQTQPPQDPIFQQGPAAPLCAGMPGKSQFLVSEELKNFASVDGRSWDMLSIYIIYIRYVIDMLYIYILDIRY